MPCPAAPNRLARTTVAALMATLVGTAAHVAGGGTPSWAGAGQAMAALLVPIWFLARHERAFAAIAGVQLAGQQVVHARLELGAPVDGSHLPDDVSLYGHVLAALVAAAWLRGGERRAWAAGRRAARALASWWRCARALATALPAHLPPVVPDADADPARPVAVLAHVLVRRGPPQPA